MPILPNLDQESWKYSNINAVLKKIEVAPAPCVWEMTGVSEYLQENDLVVIPRNTRVSIPLDLRLIAQHETQINCRLKIIVEAGAEVVLIERQSGEGVYWKDIDLELVIADNARMEHYRFCEEDPFCVVTERTSVEMGRDSTYRFVVMNGCAGFGRAEFDVKMNGKGGDCDLSGLALLSGKQHADTTICINHMAAHCRSSQFFKTVLNDQSRGVFQGKIHVHRDAQKTDGYQLSRNLLLSHLAEMDVKPELEIYADDVKCSHGSTTGQLDETPLFYLMSRGIDRDDARRLLLEAFMDEILDKILREDIRKLFADRIKLWLK